MTGEDYSSRLPTEMMASIFDLLAQPDVLRVARVCHRWRAVARSLPTFYAHLALKTEDLDSLPAYRQKLEQYTRRMRDAAGAGFRLSLTLNVQWDEDLISDDSGSYNSRDTHNLDKSMSTLVHQTVIRALPEYLASIIQLHVSLPQICFHNLQKSLVRPAPELQSMTLDNLDDGDFDLAIDLFSGHAPKLTTLRLTNVGLRGKPSVPALSAVCSLHLEYYTDSIIPHIAANFPALQHLTIEDLDSAEENAEDVSLALAPCCALETLVVTLGVVERGLPVALEAFLNAQSIPRIYFRLYYGYDGDVGVAVGSLLARFHSPVHLSLYLLDETEKDAVPEPLLVHEIAGRSGYPTGSHLVIELHSVDNNTRLTILVDHEESPSVVGRVVSSIPNLVTELNLGLADEEDGQHFTSLPQLTILRVYLDTLDNRYGWEIDVFDNHGPAVRCPCLDQVVICTSGRYGLERLQVIRAILREFVLTDSARPRPLLVLQGEPLPELVTSPLLLSCVRGITVGPRHAFSKTAECCSTAHVSLVSG
ncbi:hypothetical protein EXIGLDRAFT_772985 [Exidia glandulosa HHB12029]|uniref:F-box domain-containing protein n=1 Tax=Exidia glandulosa HHB12029 TaxID=1314781 RepID=A0A165F0N2_EXIGL|nr:hypothetical protein EXIGLDRAFT_772985 [Exidia glandulosa HHB12029]